MRGAAGRRVLERQVFGAQRDRDVVFGVGDGDLQLALDAIGRLRLDAEAQGRAVVLEHELAVVHRGEGQRRRTLAGRGVEPILREAREVLVGELLHLLRGGDAVAIRIEPLDLPDREGLVERPGVADRRQLARIVEVDRHLGIDEDVRMGRGATGEAEHRRSGEQELRSSFGIGAPSVS